jgi:hypothetical protein
MAPAFGTVIATPERRDPTASAVARPVNKAPARRAVIATPQSGGPFVRVPPASNAESARGSKPQGRDPLGSVHESRSGTDAPLRPLHCFKRGCCGPEQKRPSCACLQQDPGSARRRPAEVPDRRIHAHV